MYAQFSTILPVEHVFTNLLTELYELVSGTHRLAVRRTRLPDSVNCAKNCNFKVLSDNRFTVVYCDTETYVLSVLVQYCILLSELKEPTTKNAIGDDGPKKIAADITPDGRFVRKICTLPSTRVVRI